MRFKIYAGMSGSFGGAKYQTTEDYNCADDALEDAYNLAIEEYQSYEGLYGIMGWEDCYEELKESGCSFDEAAVDTHYQEEIESWIEYYVEPTEDE